MENLPRFPKLLQYGLYVLVILIACLASYIYLHSAPDRPVEILKKRWAQAPSQFLTIAGMDIHLRDEGPKADPEPIILIHGTSASLHTWNGWAEILTAKRRVIRFDLPGFGLTGPDPKNNYSIEHYAEIVVAVLDELKVNRAVLAGNSLGGHIAWVTAVLYPSKVSKLVLIDATGYAFEPVSIPLAFKLSQNPITSLLLKNVLPKSLVEASVRNVYGNPDLVSDALVDRYYELALRSGNRVALTERFKQSFPGTLAEKIKTINIPTLIIWGGKDRLVPPKFGQQFKQDIVNSQLVFFDELGHVPHEEAPEKTALVVEEFLVVNKGYY